MYQLCSLLKLTPTTNAEIERIVSALKSIKIYSRSTMGEKRLNGQNDITCTQICFCQINHHRVWTVFTTRHLRKSFKTRSVGV